MAVDKTIVQVRPNTGVSWYDSTDEIKAYIQTNYRDTGKITNSVDSVSGDGLTKTTTVTYNNTDSVTEFLYDDTVRSDFIIARRNYNNSNNITLNKDDDPDYPQSGHDTRFIFSKFSIALGLS